MDLNYKELFFMIIFGFGCHFFQRVVKEAICDTISRLDLRVLHVKQNKPAPSTSLVASIVEITEANED